MSWEIILTSAVVAALVSVIKSIIDNKAKRNDSIVLFRYTKLYEAVSDLQMRNENIDVNKPHTVELERSHNIQKSYSLARPLIDSDLLVGIDNAFSDVKDAKLELIKLCNQESVHEGIIRLIEATGRAEKLFELATRKQLERLLKTKQ